MRILRIIITVDPKYGGPVEGMRLSTMRLAELGHETEVATLDDPNAPFVESFPFPVHALGPGWRGYRYTSRLARWIATEGHRFDAAVVHGLWNHAPIGGWQGLKKAKLPYAVFTHGMLDPWFNSVQPIKRWAKQAFWLVAQGWVLHDANAVLFTTEEEKRLAATSFWGPRFLGEVVAYAGGDVSEGTEQQETAFRAAVPGLGNKDYLLYLSRIHPKKGCDLLVEAFVDIAHQNPGIDLVIAGPDQVALVAGLSALAQERGIGARVHFPGMLRGDAKAGAFRGAEAFILPSHQENFGIVVAEAMASASPVLISNKVNIWREVEACGGGVVAPDTLEGTRTLLKTFMNLPRDMRKEMGRKARAGYEANFSVDNAAHDLLGVLERIRRNAR